MHFINRCTWKSSQYYITISRMTSFMRMSQKLVFHQSKCIWANKRILSTTAMYVSSSSFMYLRFPCYCDACLNSSDLRVGLKTLFNTIKYLSCLSNLCTRFEARPDSPLRERGKVYERVKRCFINWSPDRAEELIVFDHNVINLYFTANKSTMCKSYFDKVYELL